MEIISILGNSFIIGTLTSVFFAKCLYRHAYTIKYKRIAEYEIARTHNLFISTFPLNFMLREYLEFYGIS